MQPKNIAERPASAEERLAPSLILLPNAVVLFILGLQLAAPSFVESHALYPLLAGIVLLGLPHGALDHLIPARLGLAWGRKTVGCGPLLARLYRRCGALFRVMAMATSSCLYRLFSGYHLALGAGRSAFFRDFF